MGVDISVAAPGVRVTLLRSRLRGALAQIGKSRWALDVWLTDDDGIWALNKTWRGIDAPTDVLSFPALAGPGPKALGDIAVSVPTASRQAASVGHGVDDEVWVLCVHGLAHLLGHDHEEEAATARMIEAEQALLGGLVPGLVARASPSAG